MSAFYGILLNFLICIYLVVKQAHIPKEKKITVH